MQHFSLFSATKMLTSQLSDRDLNYGKLSLIIFQNVPDKRTVSNGFICIVIMFFDTWRHQVALKQNFNLTIGFFGVVYILIFILYNGPGSDLISNQY